MQESCEMQKFLSETLPEIGFQLSVPNTYLSDETSSAPNESFLLGSNGHRLAKLHDSSNAAIRVWLNVLPREIGPADWMDEQISRVRGKVTQLIEVPTKGGSVGVCVVLTKDCSEDHATYLTCIKDANRFFTVAATTVKHEFEARAAEFHEAIQSFQLINPTGPMIAEPLIDVTALPQTTFNYPASWSATLPDLDSHAIVQLANHHDGNHLGSIEVKFLERKDSTSVARYIEQHAKALQDSGFQISGSPVVPVRPPGGFTRGDVFNPQVQRDGRTFETPIVVFSRPDFMISVTLIGVSRADSSFWWAVNKRAFEIIRDSISVQAR